VYMTPESFFNRPNMARYAPQPYLPKKLGGTSFRLGSTVKK